MGEFTAARADIEKGLTLYDPAYRPFYSKLTPNDMLVQLLVHAPVPLACLGYLDQASKQLKTALTEARRLSAHNTAIALAWACCVGCMMRSDLNTALGYADETLAISAEHGLGFIRAWAVLFRGALLAELGHVPEGISLISKGWADVREVGFLVLDALFLTVLAHARLLAGEYELALKDLAEARRNAERTGGLLAHAETLRLQGEVLLANGDSAAAEISYCEAVAIAQQQSARLRELRAASSLARLWRDQGKRSEARDLLAPIYTWFTEGFDALDLVEARALLDELAR